MRALLLCVALCAATPSRADTECSVSAEEWSRPRSAAMVLALAGVRDCVRAWQAEPARRIALLHVANEEGALWATELRDWLVALGIPAAQLDLRAVGSDPQRLLLRVEAPLPP